MRGTCRLCQRENVDLRKSHGIPAGISRSILGDPAKGNPNPYLITPKGAVQTSKQQTAPILCGDCEQLFSKRGEHWVLKNSLRRDGTFPLASILASHQRALFDPRNPQTCVHYAASIPEINVSALTYFGMSMFWRMAVYPWKSDNTPAIKLGTYEEPLRKFLLDEGAFPENAVLWVAVRKKSEISQLTIQPFTDKRGLVHLHKFPMPGLAFTLVIGKDLPETITNACIVHGPGNPIVTTSVIEEHLLRDAAKLLERAGR